MELTLVEAQIIKDYFIADLLLFLSYLLEGFFYVFYFSFTGMVVGDVEYCGNLTTCETMRGIFGSLQPPFFIRETWECYHICMAYETGLDWCLCIVKRELA